MPHKKIIELVCEILRFLVLLAVRQQMPNDGFLLRQRVFLPITKIELCDQIHRQADQPEACETLQRQPP